MAELSTSEGEVGDTPICLAKRLTYSDLLTTDVRWFRFPTVHPVLYGLCRRPTMKLLSRESFESPNANNLRSTRRANATYRERRSVFLFERLAVRPVC